MDSQSGPPEQPSGYPPPQRPQDHPHPGNYPPPQQGGQPPQQPGPYPQQPPPGYQQPQPGYQPPPGYQQQPLPPYWSPEQPPPWTGQPPGGQPPWAQGPHGPVPYGMRPVEPRTIPAPPGTPYHQLARNAKHTWWRPLVGTAMLAAAAIFLTAAVVIAWAIVHAMFTGGEVPEPQGNDIFPNDLENLALTLVMLAVLSPAVALTAWVVQRRPAWSVASVLNRIRWRWLLLCCLPAAGYLAVSYVLQLLADALFPNAGTEPGATGSWVGFAAFIGPALVIVLLVPFQSAAEEFMFRGWLIQAIGAYAPQGTSNNAFIRTARLVLRTPWPALVISSAVFVAAHGYTGWAMADIFLFAMVMGYVTVRTGGIEAAIALHALNNLLAFLLPAATGDLDGWADQGGAPWTLLATDIPSMAVFTLAVLWLAKRQRVARVSAEVPAEHG
ncbi:CPBP family intramembrane glutamic endopeptidase [Kribbella caucasensis]|nr:CPBP family intramembrane glutamic endopeptidase [Kribbella sp. VKM Ac-2527]